jgi:mRNA interferase RelE/StbE
MALYKVEINRQVRKKDLPAIPSKARARIVLRIKKLAQDPFPTDSIRLKGRNERRIRQGDYRILYLVQEDIVTVFVIKVGHRKEIYRK